jgi:hypothetical protein
MRHSQQAADRVAIRRNMRDKQDALGLLKTLDESGQVGHRR